MYFFRKPFSASKYSGAEFAILGWPIGYKTLLVDLDSQCNTTYTYLDPAMIQTTLADVLVGPDGIARSIRIEE